MTDRALRHVVMTQLPGVDGDGITTAEKVQLVNEVSETRIDVDVMSALRFDPASPMYGAVRSDTEPSSAVKAANRAAIQQAAEDARTSGGTLVIKGTYWIDDTIQILCHVDGASGRINVNDTSINPAVLVGYQNGLGQQFAPPKQIILPGVWQMGKTSPGWSGNDCGIRIGAANQQEITVTRVNGFSVGIEMGDYDKRGCCYNTITLGLIHNNKIGLDFQTAADDLGSWVNENLFINGRFAVDGSEGTNIPGVRHIRMGISASGHTFNNNVFLKPSVESHGPEYHVEIGGTYNAIYHARWEAYPPKLRWVGTANHNIIYHGYYSQQLEITGNGRNSRVIDPRYDTFAGGGATGPNGVMRLANNSGAAHPAILVTNPEDLWNDPASTYRVAIGADATNFKNRHHNYPRVQILGATGKVLFGDGVTSNPSLGIEYFNPSSIRLTSGTRLYMTGSWQEPLMLGAVRLWVTGNGTIWKKSGSDPTSSTDGTEVG